MKRLKNKDFISGLLLVILTLFAWFSTKNFDKSSISAYGNPATVPRVIIIILFAFAVMIMIDGLKKKNEDNKTKSKDPVPLIQKLPELLTFILLTLYVALLRKVGFVITTAVYLFFQIFVLSNFNIKKSWQYALIAVIVSPILYYLFRVYFNVFLPAGVLNWNP